jgi:hypothetical protein
LNGISLFLSYCFFIDEKFSLPAKIFHSKLKGVRLKDENTLAEIVPDSISFLNQLQLYKDDK